MAMRKRGKKSTALSTGAELPAAVDGLFAKVVKILDRARVGVVRSVNSEMLLAYWHVGREIVEALQGGSERDRRRLGNLSDKRASNPMAIFSFSPWGEGRDEGKGKRDGRDTIIRRCSARDSESRSSLLTTRAFV